MKLPTDLLSRIESDLGLNRLFVKGEDIPVKDCWHFYTNGNDIDIVFQDDEDFKAGMNRIFVTVQEYNIIILAFCLMTTHMHFILYGDFDDCKAFMHDYVWRTSRHIMHRHNLTRRFDGVNIHHQDVDTQEYLKTVICYTIKNPPVGGMTHMGWSYPWSSGALYFVGGNTWSSSNWTHIIDGCPDLKSMSTREQRALLKSGESGYEGKVLPDGIVFPGEYVAYGLVEKLFKSCKSFNYFMCKTKEKDVDERGGSISWLTLPMQEMRQHKNELCQELFGVRTTGTLNTGQRLTLAKALRSRYNSSKKQISRLCGLNYEEVKDMF